MTHPERKANRIPQYNYAAPNYYFVTICTHEKQCLFGTVEQLNGFGQIAAELLLKIPEHFPNAYIDKFVVMPNHIHAIIILKETPAEQGKSLSIILGQYSRCQPKTPPFHAGAKNLAKIILRQDHPERTGGIGMHGDTSTKIRCDGITIAGSPVRIRPTRYDKPTLYRGTVNACSLQYP